MTANVTPAAAVAKAVMKAEPEPVGQAELELEMMTSMARWEAVAEQPVADEGVLEGSH